MSDTEEKPFLTLTTCRLYAEDVALFRPAQWLNDACISFFFEVLQAAADLYYSARARPDSQRLAEGIAHLIVEGVKPFSENNEEMLRHKLGLCAPASEQSSNEAAMCSLKSRQEAKLETSPSLGWTNHDNEAHVCSPVLFVDPCVAFLVSMCCDGDEVQDTLQTLRLPLRSVVVWPLTDHLDSSVSGGTHWTLLIQIACSRGVEGNTMIQHGCNSTHGPVKPHSRYKFFHFDSLGHKTQRSRGNLAAAQRLQGLLGRFVKIPTSAESPEIAAHDKPRSTPVPLCCVPPQSNASDCGVYCLLFAERLLQLLVRKDREYFKDKTDSGNHRRPNQTASSIEMTARLLYPEHQFDLSWLSLPELQRFDPLVVSTQRRDALLLANRLARREGLF
uniref:Ubiquitin-like protease family profile domain-containing protein n=1 Tax=Toxoplasma gondii (strain ATCC 50861 / VEG) TaxID=432359 RepID=A0A0F7UZ49_TOXGV|nr:TPA: hypothetical protein BN1205_016275 [Toxoplasma gondii VEG]